MCPSHDLIYDLRIQAIYFGSAHWKGNTGFGSGPWLGADLEAGMYFGGGNATIVNNASQPLTSDFVSLHLKGLTDGFVLKGGDATGGRLATMYNGPRPDPKLACCVTKTDTYQPMRKKGAVILGKLLACPVCFSHCAISDSLSHTTVQARAVTTRTLRRAAFTRDI